MPCGQSGTVNSASRGRGLTWKPVAESNLCLCAPAQVPAVISSPHLGVFAVAAAGVLCAFS